MAGPFTLIQQVRHRLLRQKQLNAAGFFLPLAFSSWILGYLLLHVFPFPLVVLFFLPLGCCGFLWAALRKARISMDLEATAALLDEKIEGQDRFLTLVTASQSATEASFYSVVQQQAEQRSKSFLPKRDFPFTVDRRVLISGCCALFSILLWLSLSYWSHIQSSLLTLPQAGSDAHFQEKEIAALEKAARRLMQHSTTQQEQRVGSQLLALARQLKDPSLSPQEKQKLIEETQKRIKLDLPLPQLFPFDLKIFASNNQEGKEEGNEKNTSQGGKTQSAEADSSNGQPQQSTSSIAPGGNESQGNESQQETKPNAEKKKQPQPQNGGGVTFNFPQTQTKNQKQAPQEPSGAGQQPSQNPAQQGLSPGTDPNRLGGSQNDRSHEPKNQQGETEKTGEGQSKDGSGGANVGQGKGQRFLKPGEQAGGGFLTEEARFVKVRIPIGQEAQGDGGNYTKNNGRAVPKTPYSNVPLKEAASEQTQAKQPIPLEYRSIFKK